MRRSLSIILSFIYFSLSTSASVNLHFCGGDLKDIDINTEQQSCCCGIESNLECCDSEIVTLEIDLDQISSIVKSKIPKTVEVESELFCSINKSESLKEKDLTEYILLKPPKKEPIWLLNCTVTYYG